MSDPTVTNLLKQLHEKLEGTSTITETDRELLRKLSADIEGFLDVSPADHDRNGLIERLRTEVTRFEVSHPDLTATLSHVSKALGDMGI